MRKRTVIIFGTPLIFMLIGASLVLANTENTISDFFKEKDAKLETISNSDIAVEGKGVEGKRFKISYKDYIEYKENLSLVQKLNEVPDKLNSKEIINRMIKDRLLIQYAKTANVEVTNNEVKEYALQTKEAVEQSANPDMQRIHTELAKDKNVSKDDYFTQPDVLEQYKNILLENKLINDLYEQGKLNDDYTLDEFTKDLMNKSQSSIKINQKLIKDSQ